MRRSFAPLFALLFSAAGWLTGPVAAAAALTPDRLAGHPDRQAWEAYRQRSEAHARSDAAALEAELAAGHQAARAESGGDFRLPEDASAGWYGGREAGELADAILSYQTPSGGWSKKLGYANGPRRPGMQWTSQSDPGEPPHYQATFDNDATVNEIMFLAGVAAATGREDCRAAVKRGLEFVLAAQYPNGGWPQVYPLEGGYHDAITFNDGTMVNVLGLLRRAAAGDSPFSGIDEALRDRLAAAHDAGVACVLRCQVERDGRKTGWCAQHDPLTLAPAEARVYEPAALSGLESADVVRFLMAMPQPSAEVVAAIEGGLAWLESVKLVGLSRIEQRGRTVYVADASATTPFWARFYDLASDRPLFPGRDGKTYDTWAALAAANDKLGYDYLSTRPGSVLGKDQKKWRKGLAQAGRSGTVDVSKDGGITP